MTGPYASVIVPTYRRDETLVETVRQLLAQEVDDAFEVIIVDQTPEGSPTTAAFIAAQGDDRVRIVTTTPPNLPRARNVGTREARGEIVLFIDDDVQLPKGWLAAHLANFADACVHAVAGRITDVRWPGSKGDVVGEFSWYGRDRTNLDYDKRARIRVGGGGNLSVRKRSYNAIGGFDERFGAGIALREESDFYLRLHARFGGVIFDPEARLVHLAVGSGGCRVPRYAQRPEVYRNETLFFLKNFRRVGLPIFLGITWMKYAVVYPWRNGELTPRLLVEGTSAMARGTAAGIALTREKTDAS